MNQRVHIFIVLLEALGHLFLVDRGQAGRSEDVLHGAKLGLVEGDSLAELAVDLLVYLSLDVRESEELIVLRPDLLDIRSVLDLPVLNDLR